MREHRRTMLVTERGQVTACGQAYPSVRTPLTMQTQAGQRLRSSEALAVELQFPNVTHQHKWSEVTRMKKAFGLALIAVLTAAGVCAQENKYEVTVQGSGFFPKQTTKNSVTNKPTHSGGALVGFRFNLNNKVAVEGDYDYFRNSQKFLAGGGLTRIATNVHSITVDGVVKLPTLRNVRPFAIAGGGIMVFDPRKVLPSNSQTRATFVYGGGLDMPLPVRHVAFRAQYRGLIYKIPDFDTSKLKTDKYTHSAVPSAGLVLTF